MVIHFVTRVVRIGEVAITVGLFFASGRPLWWPGDDLDVRAIVVISGSFVRYLSPAGLRHKWRRNSSYRFRESYVGFSRHIMHVLCEVVDLSHETHAIILFGSSPKGAFGLSRSFSTYAWNLDSTMLERIEQWNEKLDSSDGLQGYRQITRTPWGYGDGEYDVVRTLRESRKPPETCFELAGLSNTFSLSGLALLKGILRPLRFRPLDGGYLVKGLDGCSISTAWLIRDPWSVWHELDGLGFFHGKQRLKPLVKSIHQRQERGVRRRLYQSIKTSLDVDLIAAGHVLVLDSQRWLAMAGKRGGYTEHAIKTCHLEREVWIGRHQLEAQSGLGIILSLL